MAHKTMHKCMKVADFKTEYRDTIRQTLTKKQ